MFIVYTDNRHSRQTTSPNIAKQSSNLRPKTFLEIYTSLLGMTRAPVQVSCCRFQCWGSQSSHSTFPAIHQGGSLPQTCLDKPKHQTCASFSSGSFLVKGGGRMKKDQMQDKTEKWRFRSYKENAHETEMPSGEAKCGIVLSSPNAASNMWQRHTVTKSCSFEAVKIGPFHIRKESGHTAKPIPAKLCSPAPTGVLLQ